MIIKLSTSVKIIVDVILVGRCWEIWWWRGTKIVWCWEQWLNIICLLPRLSMILPIQSAGWACGTVNTSTTISTIIFIWWLETSVTCISSRILSSKEISNYEDVVVAKEKVYTRGGSQSKRCIKKQGQDERTRGAAQQLALGNNWQAVIKEWKNGGHCSNGGFQFTGKPGVKVMPSDPRI